MVKKLLFLLLGLSLSVCMLHADEFRERALQHQKQYAEAFELKKKGQVVEAFRMLLGVPGAEQLAIELAKSEPERFLKELEKPPASALQPMLGVVRGDLLLAAGKKNQALIHYRKAAASLKSASDQADGWLRDYYPVETEDQSPMKARTALSWDGPAGNRSELFTINVMKMPFRAGPGSHRDNLLLRRFIAFEAWGDAAAEFQRVWAMHQRRVQPYVISLPVENEAGNKQDQWLLVSPAGYDGLGLQFAIDYAFFLKRRNKGDEGRSLLLGVLRQVDMERNPNRSNHARGQVVTAKQAQKHRQGRSDLANHYGYLFNKPEGIARKEFIRLVYGEYRNAGKEKDLVDAVEAWVAADQLSAIRLLARIRMHQGRADDALALEFDFIKRSGFSAVTATYRRGALCQEFGRLEEAVGHFESFLALEKADGLLSLPDLDEDETERNGLWIGRVKRPVEPGEARADVARRLVRICSAQGDTAAVLKALLVEMEEAGPSLDLLEEAGRRYEAADRWADFAAWMKKRVEETKDPNEQAMYYWMLAERERCATLLVEGVKEHKDARSRLSGWFWKFHKEGDAAVLLRALQQAFPDDAAIRIELMELEQRFVGADAIEGWEDILECRAKADFDRRPGHYHALKFRGYHDLAYRLMRAYEKVGRLDDLRALGMRVAKREAPFDEMRSGYYADKNGPQEDLNACLALLVHHANAATLKSLEQLWNGDEDHAGPSQLRRRQRGSFAQAEIAKDFGWTRMPSGVRAIASTLTVLSMDCDDSHVYAGHPWGISVSKHDGSPVTRLALGQAVQALAVAGDHLWAGTAGGLFRITRGDWEVARMWPDGDVPENGRGSKPEHAVSNESAGLNNVLKLALDGEQLWIGTSRDIQKLDLNSLALRVYSNEEIDGSGHERCDRILLDTDYVWVECHSGLRRYDRKTDRWQKVEYEKRKVGLIALVDGRLFGEAYINDALRSRPCLIDRDSLEIHPIKIAGDEEVGSKKRRMINGPYFIIGMEGDSLIFGQSSRNNERFIYDEKADQLNPVPKTETYPQPVVGWVWPKQGSDLAQVIWDQPITSELLAGKGLKALRQPVTMGDEYGYWMRHIRPGGRSIVTMRGRTPDYHFPRSEWPYDHKVWERKVGRDQMLSVSPDGKQTSPFPHRFADAIDGNVVFSLLRDEASDQLWACTDLGVALLDTQDRVRAVMTKADGLPANRVPDCAMVTGKPVFACGHGDYGGGLVVAEPSTKVLSGFYQSDGLASNKLSGVEEKDGKAKVSYATESDPLQNHRTRICEDSLFDIGSASHVSGGEPGYDFVAWQKRQQIDRDNMPKVCPILGGLVIDVIEHEGKTYYCGTRGLVIVSGSEKPVLDVETLSLKLKTDDRVALKAEADRVITFRSIKTRQDFRKFIANENPYVRELALRYCNRVFHQDKEALLPDLWKLLKDPHTPVRLGALRRLKAVEDERSIPHLQPLLKDPEPQIRDEAAIMLARLGKRPKLALFEGMLERGHSNPFGFEAHEAVARNAGEDAFKLLLKHPVSVDDYEPRQRVFELLGESLRKNPQHADVLLPARSKKGDRGPKQNWGEVRFVQEVFRHAGKPLLPKLHEALASGNRVIRSNAARACGAIKDPSSIPVLMKAMDLESGLSRASIVWALGELEAVEALPMLRQQFIDAQNDQKRRRGAGFRASQAAQSIGFDYDSLSRVDRVQGDWLKLKEENGGREINPRTHEWLLSPSIVVDAIRAVGAEHSPGFFRSLAAHQGYGFNHIAAEALAEAGEVEREKNLAVLRNFLGDEDAETRARAAVSLLILKEPSAQQVILGWLKPPDPKKHEEQTLTVELMKQLMRVERADDLKFAKKALEALATLPPPQGNSTLNVYAKHVVDKIERGESKDR